MISVENRSKTLYLTVKEVEAVKLLILTKHSFNHSGITNTHWNYEMDCFKVQYSDHEASKFLHRLIASYMKWYFKISD